MSTGVQYIIVNEDVDESVTRIEAILAAAEFQFLAGMRAALFDLDEQVRIGQAAPRRGDITSLVIKRVGQEARSGARA